MEAEALAKRHSLTREAVQTGQQCGAYRTLLTHFSQRYPKIPVFDDSFASSTCIAFDMMTVNLAGASSLPLCVCGSMSASERCQCLQHRAFAFLQAVNHNSCMHADICHKVCERDIC